MFTLLYVTDEMRYAIRVIKDFCYHSLCCIRRLVVHSQCPLTRPLPKTWIENFKLEENPCSAKGWVVEQQTPHLVNRDINANVSICASVISLLINKGDLF